MYYIHNNGERAKTGSLLHWMTMMDVKLEGHSFACSCTYRGHDVFIALASVLIDEYELYNTQVWHRSFSMSTIEPLFWGDHDKGSMSANRSPNPRVTRRRNKISSHDSHSCYLHYSSFYSIDTLYNAPSIRPNTLPLRPKTNRLLSQSYGAASIVSKKSKWSDLAASREILQEIESRD